MMRRLLVSVSVCLGALALVVDAARSGLDTPTPATPTPSSTQITGSATKDLGNVGFTHVKTNISASGDPAHIAMPCVHRVASLLKRWLLGTYQGGVSIRQLDFYLDEFVFRFNRRTSRSRGLLFYRLMSRR
jgi:hypothetical protein